MNIKKIIITLSFLLLLTCGYEPMYSKKNVNLNYNFSINEINFVNEISTNNFLKNNLRNYINKENKLYNYSLNLNTTVNKKIATKNLQGETEIFTMTINVNLTAFSDKNLISSVNFKENFEYKNTPNKFNLSQYEDSIKKYLINKISNDIVLYLHSLK